MSFIEWVLFLSLLLGVSLTFGYLSFAVLKDWIQDRFYKWAALFPPEDDVS